MPERVPELKKLVHFTQTARVITDAEDRILPAEQVQVATFCAFSLETVGRRRYPFRTNFGQPKAVMTGESLPVDKATGDLFPVVQLTSFGAFTMRATKVGEDSSIKG